MGDPWLAKQTQPQQALRARTALCGHRPGGIPDRAKTGGITDRGVFSKMCESNEIV